MMGYLASLFCNSIVFPDIKFQITVRRKEYVIARPCWKLVCTFKVCDLFRCVILKIIDPEIGGSSSLIAFPVPEFAVNRGKYNSRTIGRENCESSVDNLKRFFETAIKADEVIFTISFSECCTVSPDKDLFAVGGPVERYVVISSSGRHNSNRIVPCKLAWDTSV